MSRIIRSTFPKLLQPFCRALATEAELVGKMDEITHSIYDEETEPVISTKKYFDEERFYMKPRQAWIENMDTVPEKKLGLITLHPDIFAAQPRIDVIHENVRWQRLYRWVSYAHANSRAECPGGGRKPWPQKGLGRARHGSIRSPLWIKGGIAHGPRSHTTYYYMLPFYTRVLGLMSTLSVKLAQDDFHVVNDLEIPTEDPQFMLDLVHERKWGPSVLFIDRSDIVPQNIAIATDNIKHINLMPAYGLNVYSMLKHDTLVLTKSAVHHIEDKLLYHLNRSDPQKVMKEPQL